MVDVAGKPVTHRVAVAEAFVEMPPETLALIVTGTAPKGDVLAVARVAGIMAAKRTSELIPLCHPLPLTTSAVDLEADERRGPGSRITRDGADRRQDRRRDGGADRGRRSRRSRSTTCARPSTAAWHHRRAPAREEGGRSGHWSATRRTSDEPAERSIRRTT